LPARGRVLVASGRWGVGDGPPPWRTGSMLAFRVQHLGACTLRIRCRLKSKGNTLPFAPFMPATIVGSHWQPVVWSPMVVFVSGKPVPFSKGRPPTATTGTRTNHRFESYGAQLLGRLKHSSNLGRISRMPAPVRGAHSCHTSPGKTPRSSAWRSRSSSSW
jgi:hypothetical protein